jgi:hypothetical protein
VGVIESLVHWHEADTIRPAGRSTVRARYTQLHTRYRPQLIVTVSITNVICLLTPQLRKVLPGPSVAKHFTAGLPGLDRPCSVTYTCVDFGHAG